MTYDLEKELQEHQDHVNEMWEKWGEEEVLYEIVKQLENLNHTMKLIECGLRFIRSE